MDWKQFGLWSSFPVVKFRFAVGRSLMGIFLQDASEGSKPLTPFRSFGNSSRQSIVKVPTRSKSVISAFFVKQKTLKLRAGSFS